MKGSRNVLELRINGLGGAIVFISVATGVFGFAAGLCCGFGLSREADTLKKENPDAGDAK